MIRGVTSAALLGRPRTRVVVVKSDSTSRPSLTDRLRQQGMHLAYTAVRTAMRVTGDPTSRLLEGQDLLRAVLVKDPTQRISSHDFFRHP